MQKHMFPAWCVDSVDDVFPIISRLPTFLSAEGLLLGNGMEWGYQVATLCARITSWFITAITKFEIFQKII